mmetsp:Transcript_2099/g.3260  ORF Transcript_2099/g.3260 Transcript_2099/m.3260 type:complete len:132 (-) Transcript_2099:139-534(-)
MLGQPQDALWVNWLSLVLLKGVRISARSCILFRNAGSNETCIANISSVFCVTTTKVASLSRRVDAAFFISAIAWSPLDLLQPVGVGVGNISIASAQWKEKATARVFACTGVEVSELIHHHVSGSHRFIMCP